MKKIFLLFFIIIITGCMRYTELNDLAIIKSIGIERNNEYTLYLEIIDEVDKDNKPKTTIKKTNGKNIQELFTNINKTINKDVYLSHIDLLILDERLNHNDYQNIFKYFINNHKLRNDFLTIMSNDIKKLLENTKYDEIEKLIQNKKNNIIKISFEEIISNYLNKNNFKFFISKYLFIY